MTVAIIGAGYAGMAAAVELTAAGMPCTVFEASRRLGGRARVTEVEGLRLDNGQHIFIGAYRETLRLMTMVGADPARLLRRLPLNLEFPGRMRIVTPRLPAPLHMASALLGASGLTWRDKFAAIQLMRRLAALNYHIEPDPPLAEWLTQQRQTADTRRYLWEPLCISALNTPVAKASAQVFAKVLRDSLAGAAADSDMLLPLTDLSSLFPEPAAAWAMARGANIRRGTRVEKISRSTGGFLINDAGPFRSVIIAVAPQHLARLVAGLPGLDEVLARIAALRYEPIVTAYLRYSDTVRLPQPMLGFAEGHLQWLFDRGQLGGPAGLLAGVISARGKHQELDSETLIQRLHEEITTVLPGLTPPTWNKVIVEKRATFACTPGLARPAMETPIPGLLLAGDYLNPDYPATIESAVRSGVAAAQFCSARSR